MKKILILLFVVISFVGCSTGTGVEDDYTENEVVEPTKEPVKPVEEPTVEPPVIIENPTLEDFSKVKDLSYLKEFYGVAEIEDYKDDYFLMSNDPYINVYSYEYVNVLSNNGFSDNGRKVFDAFVDFIKSNFSEDFYRNKAYEITYKDNATLTKSKRISPDWDVPKYEYYETKIEGGKVFLIAIFTEKNGEIQLGRRTYIKAENNE